MLPPYLTKPRWLVGHLIVAALVVGFVTLGLWQLRRLDDRREHNATVLSRSGETIPLPQAGWQAGDHDDLTYRRTEVTGTYDAAGEVLVRFRSRLGLPGYEVLTPLLTAEGAVLVDRGWVPLADGDRWPTPEEAPPTGQVTVSGLLAPPEGGGERASRQGSGPLVVSAIVVDDLRPSLPYDRVYGLHLIVDGSSTTFPVPVDPPDLTEGSHLSYAFQWFAFAVVGVLSWGFLVARRARRRVGDDAEPEAPPVADAGFDDSARREPTAAGGEARVR